ncbi:MAG: D-isomer specific 2-hydroxyacid [Planctomycetota bacterium]|nr:MAG: D-isomer specific 2-hydroxyacid [Planctomycetota bacterium]
MPRVLVTRPIPEAGLALLFPHVTVEMSPGPLQPGEIARRGEGCAGILCQLTDKIGADVLDLPGLRVVATMSVGTDHIDLAAARKRFVTVTNTPGCLTEATAELAFALILATARRLGEAERFLRAGRFKGWDPMLLQGQTIVGKRLGILGAGRIGQEVARMAKGFRMEVVYHSRLAEPEFEKECGARAVSKDELAATSDVVSIHTPLTAETKHLVDAAFLARMKPSAILVNTSRGPVVDEGALVDALRQNRIFAAGLDVFEGEPAVHPGLLELENAILLPHIASATVDTRNRMAVMAAENLLAVLGGRAAPNCVA